MIFDVGMSKCSGAFLACFHAPDWILADIAGCQSLMLAPGLALAAVVSPVLSGASKCSGAGAKPGGQANGEGDSRLS